MENGGHVTRKELKMVVKSLENAAKMGEIVDVSEKLHGLLEIKFRRSFWDGIKMTNLISKGSFTLRLAGAFNLADVVPWLGAFDLQGAIDQLFEKIIKEHEEAPNTHKNEKHRDFMGILVSLMHQPKDDEQNHDIITRDDIKATTLSLISMAYETVAVTVEWTMSEFLRHPRVTKNLQNELKIVIGMNKMVEETDLSKLNYMNLVVMENFRLDPAVPLFPRASAKDVMVGGYYTEKSTES